MIVSEILAIIAIIAVRSVADAAISSASKWPTVESRVSQSVNEENRYVGLPSQRPERCYRDVEKCVPLNSTQCLDVTLPYKFTSAIAYNYSITEAHNYLSQWRGLQGIPQCWKALQSVLCASLFPRCDNDANHALMPTYEMCRFTRSPCRLIDWYYEWPEFLRCDNEMLFPTKCKNEYTDLKFNTSAFAKCAPPLVNSDDSNIWYPGIDGCALQCRNPIYSEDEHRRISWFVSHSATVSLIATLYAVSTFIIDWRSSNRYPAVIIFYLNMCFMISNFGWLFQYILSKGKDEIVCRADNTSRYEEPRTPENFYCLLVFFLIYYFSMAALVWFVNLAYAWDLSFQTSSSQRDSVNTKGAYFHLTAWSVPLMLTITILALGEVDGDSLRGICFVGYQKPVIRIVFVLVPLTVSLVIGCFYMFKAMHTLIRVKLMNKSQSNVNRNRSKKIEHMIIRIAIFVIFAIIAVICTYVCHIYEFTSLSHWKESLNLYIICTLRTPALHSSSDMEECKADKRPNLIFVYLQLISFFGAGITTSSWVWTSNSLAGWKRFLIRHLKPELNEPIRIKRHELISKMFNRRHQLSQGCYSPSIHSMHDDPVGMNLNSAVSQDLSATWAAALPNFVYRRGGITSINTPNHYLPNFVGTRHSSTSDISQQRSFDSYASQRRSLDSQMSLEHLELVAMARHQRRKTKKERERLLKAHGSHRSFPYQLPVRRGSDTSGSVISSAFVARGLTKVSKCETKSTSTGDLIALLQPQPQMQFLTPSLAHSSSLALHTHPTIPFISPKVVPKRPPMPLVSNFTFTHGINAQSNQLVNPLQEKRRPDSCAPTNNANTAKQTKAPHSTSNGLITQQSFSNPLSNYSIGYMNGVNFATPVPSLNYFNPLNPYYGNLMANNHQSGAPFAGYANFMPPPQYSTPPLPALPFAQQFAFNGMSTHFNVNPLVTQQCANLQEVQSIIREREAFLPLIAPMDSSSEIGDFFPIQLSDSEGIYSDGVSRNDNVVATQRIVDEHIQRVEAEVEAKTGGNSGQNQSVCGIGDAIIGEVLEMKQLKSNAKSEKRKKKKSSNRKNRSNSCANNGHVMVNETIARNNNGSEKVINNNDSSVQTNDKFPLNE